MNYNGQYDTRKFYATHDALSTTLSTIMMDAINGIVPFTVSHYVQSATE